MFLCGVAGGCVVSFLTMVGLVLILCVFLCGYMECVGALGVLDPLERWNLQFTCSGKAAPNVQAHSKDLDTTQLLFCLPGATGEKAVCHCALAQHSAEEEEADAPSSSPAFPCGIPTRGQTLFTAYYLCDWIC